MSFFKDLFRKKKVCPPADLSILHADVHSHFIPGIDDGAATLEDSIQLISEMKQLGYKKIITTPHIMSDYYKNTSTIILDGLAVVKDELKKQTIDIELEASAEYYLDEHFMELIKKDDLLVWGKDYILFELPFISEPPMLGEAIFEIQLAGYTPVLAHPERYTYWYNTYNKYEEMMDKGVLLQLNTNSLTGHYSPATKKIAERLIDDEMISFIGSDCHHMNHIGLLNHVLTDEYLHKVLDSGKLLNNTL